MKGGVEMTDKKRINPHLTSRISIIKGYIRNSKSGFDGNGYIFKEAIRQLKKEGLEITYNKNKCAYFKGV